MKVLPCFSIGWCILFNGNTISRSSERSQIFKYLLGPRVARTTGGTSVMWRKQYQPMSNNRACKAKDESIFFFFPGKGLGDYFLRQVTNYNTHNLGACPILFHSPWVSYSSCLLLVSVVYPHKEIPIIDFSKFLNQLCFNYKLFTRLIKQSQVLFNHDLFVNQGKGIAKWISPTILLLPFLVQKLPHFCFFTLMASCIKWYSVIIFINLSWLLIFLVLVLINTKNRR